VSTIRDANLLKFDFVLPPGYHEVTVSSFSAVMYAPGERVPEKPIPIQLGAQCKYCLTIQGDANRCAHCGAAGEWKVLR